jgi:hypothetical protein
MALLYCVIDLFADFGSARSDFDMSENSVFALMHVNFRSKSLVESSDRSNPLLAGPMSAKGFEGIITDIHPRKAEGITRAS